VPARRRLLVAIAIAIPIVVAALGTVSATPYRVEIDMRYSHYTPVSVTVPAGRPIEFVLVNDDPIDHEWIVGDEALHARHRSGTEPYHASRPTEVSIDALTTRRTIVTFAKPGRLTYVCHLPGHEQYGMVGVLEITG
jgi:uncharacterized cupredoxin-like copper-binding protein